MGEVCVLVWGGAVKDAFPALADELEFVDMHDLRFFAGPRPRLEGARHVLREHVIHLHAAQRKLSS